MIITQYVYAGYPVNIMIITQYVYVGYPVNIIIITLYVYVYLLCFVTSCMYFSV